MLEPTKLIQIKQEKAANLLSQQRHNDLLKGSADISKTVLDATEALIKYLEGHTTKTQVVNQLKTINTPDALRVIPEIKSLHETLKTHKNTDLTEVIKVMNGILEESKKIPKELPKPEKQQFVDYSKQFTGLIEAVKAVEKVVKAQDLVVNVPETKLPTPQVNVEAPDLQPLQSSIADVVKAVNDIVIPEYKTDNTAVEKLIKESNKLLKDILERPVKGGGGGGGRATPYEDENGMPIFPVTVDGKIPVTGFHPVSDFDYLDVTATSPTVDTLTYKLGGSGGTTKRTTTITYASSGVSKISGTFDTLEYS